jgi:hypothetical protein
MPREYWALSLDDLSEQIWDMRSEVNGSHYIGFAGTREEVRAKLLEAFRRLVDTMIYRASSYGSRFEDGEDS